jgi:uncharacterized protein (TIGR02246 family)
MENNTMIRKNIFVMLVLTLVMMSCQSADTSRTTALSTKADEASVREVFEQSVEKWNAIDLDGLMAFIADDYVLLPPGRLEIVGKEALRASWDQFLSENTSTLKTSIEDIEISGDLAIVRIKELVTTIPKDGSETTTFNGKRIFIYRRGTDGSWKMIIDIWNNNEPKD